jgi:hypothetical protein
VAVDKKVKLFLAPVRRVHRFTAVVFGLGRAKKKRPRPFERDPASAIGPPYPLTGVMRLRPSRRVSASLRKSREALKPYSFSIASALRSARRRAIALALRRSARALRRRVRDALVFITMIKVTRLPRTSRKKMNYFWGCADPCNTYAGGGNGEHLFTSREKEKPASRRAFGLLALHRLDEAFDKGFGLTAVLDHPAVDHSGLIGILAEVGFPDRHRGEVFGGSGESEVGFGDIEGGEVGDVHMFCGCIDDYAQPPSTHKHIFHFCEIIFSEETLSPTSTYLCPAISPHLGARLTSLLSLEERGEAFDFLVLGLGLREEGLDRAGEVFALGTIPARLEAGLPEVVGSPIGPSVSGHILGGGGVEGGVEE